MKILVASSEVVPFAKTGGLADVAGSLPTAFEKLGHTVKVVMPKYKMVKTDKNPKTISKTIDVFFIENEKFFNRDGLYGEKSGDYPDNLERFSFFCKEALDLLKRIDFRPDIIHCNDWQTALIPVYLKTIYKDDAFFAKTKTVFTIHNLAYQGLFAKEQFPLAGLDWELFDIHGLEFYGKLSLLKGGLVFSDLLTTVSPTYSKEIQTKELGCGLEGILFEKRFRLYGVLNGLDYSTWNTKTDKNIYKNYDRKNIEAKYENKKMLQKENGLEVDIEKPLIGLIGRLADQKGFDLVASILDKIFKKGAQLILLGTGDLKYHILLEKVKKKHPHGISINLRYDEVLASRIYAGCDMFLMPSRYEPCGLGQLISLRYGTIPIVRKTGGLADTIEDFNPKTQNSGNGFVFERYDSNDLLNTIKRAISVFNDKAAWQRLIQRAMDYDFSWVQSAKRYVELYEMLLGGF